MTRLIKNDELVRQSLEAGEGGLIVYEGEIYTVVHIDDYSSTYHIHAMNDFHPTVKHITIIN